MKRNKYFNIEPSSDAKRGDVTPEQPQNAFTLSEVILTIGVIGIIAALTIPQLVQNSNNKELVTAFLKSNNVLANAYKNAKAIDNIHKMTSDDFKSTFKKYVKTVECEGHDICLQDGMFVDFECDEEKCSGLTVDTNGAKRPNQEGKDLFAFDITPDKITPQGEQEQCSGLDCGMYTLTYHKIFDGLIPNCKTSAAGSCTTCKDGFHLENNKCSQIVMDTCDKFNGENCTNCKNDYILINGDCINKETLNCETKSSTKEECSVCKSDYYVNNNGLCSNKCLVSNGNGTCITCDTDAGYYLKNSVCTEKPNYCKSILNDGSQCTLKNNLTAKKITLQDGTDRYIIISPSEIQSLAGAEEYCANAGLSIPSYSDVQKVYAVKNTYQYDITYYGWIYTTKTCGDNCTVFIMLNSDTYTEVDSANSVSVPEGTSGRYVLCTGN